MQTREQIKSAIESLTALAASLGHGQTLEGVTIRVDDPSFLDLGTDRRAYVYERAKGGYACVESSFVGAGEGKPGAGRPEWWYLQIRLRHYREATQEEVAEYVSKDPPGPRAKDAACKVAGVVSGHPVLGPVYATLEGPPMHPDEPERLATPAVNDLLNAFARVIQEAIR